MDRTTLPKNLLAVTYFSIEHHQNLKNLGPKQEFLVLPVVLVNNILDSTFEVIAKELKKQGKVTCSKFGTFRVSKRKAREGRNPRTGEPIQIKAGKSVRFKPSKNLKNAL